MAQYWLEVLDSKTVLIDCVREKLKMKEVCAYTIYDRRFKYGFVIINLYSNWSI